MVSREKKSGQVFLHLEDVEKSRNIRIVPWGLNEQPQLRAEVSPLGCSYEL
jgi:hypothetical protein